jgi:hypothetical protein
MKYIATLEFDQYSNAMISKTLGRVSYNGEVKYYGKPTRYTAMPGDFHILDQVLSDCTDRKYRLRRLVNKEWDKLPPEKIQLLDGSPYKKSMKYKTRKELEEIKAGS